LADQRNYQYAVFRAEKFSKRLNFSSQSKRLTVSRFSVTALLGVKNVKLNLGYSLPGVIATV